MTDIVTTDASDTGIEADDLADFAADLFSAEKPAESVEAKEDDNGETSEPAEAADDSSADAEVGTGTDEDDEGAEDGEPSEEDDEPAPVKGKPKSRFQQRIDDMTAKLREKDDQINRVLAKLEEVTKAKEAEVETPQNTPKADRGLVEPTAEDTNEDGSLKYPLGEFDPKLLRDLTRYDRAIERAHEAEVAKETQAEQAKAEELRTLQTEWNGKVEAAKETYPDYVEKGQGLLETLGEVPQDYAVYLTQHLMGMEYGPDVFYYLAEHPDEARAIVNSSPEKAINRLGRIEARFEIAADEKSGKETKLRVSNAPEPAPRNKGSNAAPPKLDLESASLDDFERELYPTKRR